MTHYIYRRVLAVALSAAFAAPALADGQAQAPFNCAANSAGNARAVQAAQDKLTTSANGGSGSSPFEQPAQVADANADCMVDFSSAVGPAVENDSLSGYLSQMIGKMNSAACAKIRATAASVKQQASQMVNSATDPSKLLNGQLPSAPSVPSSYNFDRSLQNYVNQQVAQETKAAEAKAAAAAAQQGNPDIWSSLGNILAGKTAGGLPVNPNSGSGGN